MLDKIKQLLAPEAELSAKFAVISLFVGKLLETIDRRVVDLEARQLQKGDKGDKGDRGEQGERGPKGERGEKGDVGPVGPVGPVGKDGKKGKDGKDGISVVDSEVDLDGHLVLKLSNGKVLDAGPLPELKAKQAPVAVSGNAWQVTVSATAPANPQLNDL